MLFENNTLILKSYAKINLSLRVIGKREDGYHLLEMVFLPLDLHDVIELSKIPGARDTYITCDDIGLTNQRHNLCMKAVEAMRAEFHFTDQFSIHIHKEIPFAAGLGGGSSNAAVVMMGIAKLLHLNTNTQTLTKVALTIGADVPFFFLAKPAKVSGIGEIVEQVPCKKQYFCLIVKPEEGLKTKDVYAKDDGFFNDSPLLTSSVLRGLANGDDELIAKSIHNDLFEPAKAILPLVGDIVTSLRNDGFPISNMSGSGSACFALSTDLKKIKEAARRYDKKGLITVITKTLL